MVATTGSMERTTSVNSATARLSAEGAADASAAAVPVVSSAVAGDSADDKVESGELRELRSELVSEPLPRRR